MSNIIKIDNPFRRHIKEVIQLPPGCTLRDIRYSPRILDTLPKKVEVVISVNGRIIPMENWVLTKVQLNDFVLVVPRVEGWLSDIFKSDIFKIVAMIVVVWAAPAIAGGALLGGIGFSAGLAYEIGVVAIMVGGALLINSLTPRPKMPSSAYAGNEAELSQTYGWNPATVQRQGMVRPRFYGLNKMYGNVIGAFSEVTGTTTNIQTLYALIDLGIGPYREVIVPDTIKVNDQSIDNFDDVYYRSRSGLVRQNYVDWFEKIKVEFVPNMLVKNGSPKIYETKNADFDDIEIDLTFPRGLYDATGASLVNNTVNITIDIKKSTVDSWTNLVTEDITDDTADKVIRSYTTNGNIVIARGNKYQIRVVKNTAERDDTQYGDDLFLERVREVTDEQFTYPRAALVALKALATNQLSGAIRFSCLARGLYVVNYRDSAGAIEYSTNPADVIADILTQPVISGSPSPWTEMVLLLLFNGVDAATSTVDFSEKGHSVNFTSTAQLDTAVKKFGSASLLLDGASDDINIADSDDWNLFRSNSDDVIVDMFVKHDDHVGTEAYIGQYEDASNWWLLWHVHGSGIRFYFNSSGSGIIDTGFAGEITDTDQHHVALCKIGNEYGVYVDGVQVSYVQSTETDMLTGSLFIGQQGDDTNWFDGHIDHLRIIKNNVFSAAPNSTPDDTITIPAVEYTNPGPSFAIERYDGYNPSDLDLFALEDLADWCDDIQVNPTDFSISDITNTVNAIVTTRSPHPFRVDDIVVFRDVDTKSDMVELVDGTTAIVLSVTSNTIFTVDLDTSGYTAFGTSVLKLMLQFEGADASTTFTDSSPTPHTMTPVDNAQIDTAQYKFSPSSGLFDGTDDSLTTPDSADWDLVGSNVDDWTIDLFVRFNSIAGSQYFACQYEDDDNSWNFGWLGGGFLAFYVRSGGTQIIGFDTGASFSPVVDTWYHIALCKVGNKYGIYVDGIQYGYRADSSTDTFAGLLYIGALKPSSLELNGWLDQLRISQSNVFSASPNSGKTDIITVPTTGYIAPTIELRKSRFTFNGGFDTESNMWDAVLRVCELCRCVPFFKGNKISFAIDKAASAVFAYTSGNIIKDSFRQIFIPTAERAREVEVHYRDAEQDYQRQPFTLINPNITNLTARARMDLFGITDSEMAERIADVILLKNQHIKTIAKFSADIDSIACTIGDPILAPIDATKYGQVGDGRVTTATNTGNAVVTVQGALSFEDADWDGGSTAYRLMVKTADDVIETKSIIDVTRDSADVETSITVSGTYATTPVEGDLWAAGEENYETKKYRVINLRQSERQRIEITATEYVDAVYAND